MRVIQAITRLHEGPNGKTTLFHIKSIELAAEKGARSGESGA